jgi:hypothetical protein
MKTNVSIIAFDIQNSKLIMQVLQHSRVVFFLRLFIILGKISLIKVHLDGKFKQDFYLKTNILKNGTSTKDNGTNSLAMNNAESF